MKKAWLWMMCVLVLVGGMTSALGEEKTFDLGGATITLGSYRAFLLDMGLPVQVSRVVGALPVGLAVCQKPD